MGGRGVPEKGEEREADSVTEHGGRGVWGGRGREEGKKADRSRPCLAMHFWFPQSLGRIRSWVGG